MADKTEDRVYTHAEVCKVTGMPPATLQNWVNRGLIEIDTQNPGKSAKRLYSFNDIEYITYVYEMSLIGVAPAMACDYASSIIVKRLEYTKCGEGEYGTGGFNMTRLRRKQYLVAVIDPSEYSETTFGFTTIADIGDDSIIKAMPANKPVIVFPYGYIYMELMGKIRDIKDSK